jgi:hypothetical protein
MVTDVYCGREKFKVINVKRRDYSSRHFYKKEISLLFVLNRWIVVYRLENISWVLLEYTNELP